MAPTLTPVPRASSCILQIVRLIYCPSRRKMRSRRRSSTSTWGNMLAIPSPYTTPEECIPPHSLTISHSFLIIIIPPPSPHPHWLFINNQPHVHRVQITASWSCARKSPETQPVPGEARRTTSSTSWPRCCPYRRPSPASWTRRPS